MYRTYHALPTLKAIKNDKQIAFTELSFQPFSEKFVTIIQSSKLILWNG